MIRILINFTQSRLFLFIFAIAIFLMSFSFNYAIPYDPDLGWHMRYGQEVTEHHRILLEDTFSHTFYGQPYIDSSWLIEAIYYLIFTQYSFLGLAIFSAVLTAISFLFPLIFFRSTPMFIAGTIFISLLGSFDFLQVGARTQNISWLFFSIVLTLLILFFLRRKIRYVLFLPIIFLIWANMHPGYLIGIQLILIMIFAELLSCLRIYLTEKKHPKIIFRNLLVLMIILFLCFWVTGYRPVGKGGGDLLQVVSSIFLPVNIASTIPVLGSIRTTIQEWLPPIFYDLPGTTFLLSLVLLATTYLFLPLTIKKIPFLLLVLFLVYFSTLSRRNVPFFFLGFIPLILLAAEDFKNNLKINRRIKTIIPLINILLIFVITLLSAQKIISTSNKMNGINQHLTSYFDLMRYPYKAANFVREYQPKGNMYNPYDWGGFLIWQLPEYPVFIDGRVPGKDIFTEYKDVSTFHDNWSSVLDKYKVGWMIVYPNSLFEDIITESGKWKKVYSDNLSAVLVKNEDQNTSKD